MIKSLSIKSRRHYSVVAINATSNLYLPTNPSRLICYSGGYGESKTSPFSDQQKKQISLDMIGNGWAILAIDGGLSWGNPAIYNAYMTAFTAAKELTGATRIDVWAQSMGGILGLKLLTEIGEAEHFYGIYPALNLQWFFDNWAKGDIKSAYGFSNDADYLTATAGHSPMLFSNDLYAGKKLQIFQSYSDTLTNLTDNGDVLHDKISAVADIEIVECAGAHGDVSHFQKTIAINFLKS